jgi:broad specificity phosphatase PhoE
MSLLLGDLLNTKRFRRIYSSDLQRARTTLELALSRCSNIEGIPIEPSEFVREVSYGLFESLPINLSLQEAKLYRAEERGVSVDEVMDDRESAKSIQDRQRQFVQKVVADCAGDFTEVVETEEEYNVLCVSHGGYLKRFFKTICGLKLGDEKIENSSVSIVYIRIDEDGNVKCTAKKDEVNLGFDSTYIP